MKNNPSSEPIAFGAQMSGIQTPSKTKTPSKKKLSAEEQEKLALKKQQDHKRRSEMKEDIVRRKDSLKTMLSPKKGTPLKGNGAEVVEIVTSISEPPKSHDGEDSKIRQWLSDENRGEMRKKIEFEKQVMNSPKSKEPVSHLPHTHSSSPLVDGVLEHVRLAVNSYERQLRNEIEEKYRRDMEALKLENERLKATQAKSPKKPVATPGPMETVEQLKVANETLKKELVVARAKAVVAEQRALTMESDLNITRAERADLTKLCDELIAKLESGSVPSSDAQKAHQ
jgi:hypothetical protein